MKIKRITAFALVLIFCLGLVSCAKDEAPDGMYLVSLEGEPFKLYVPQVWKDNRSSGVSGAYYSMMEKITVSARYYTPEDDSITLAEYAEMCESEYAQTLDGFMSDGIASTVLGGENARELIFTFEDNKNDFTCRQMIAKYEGDFIILSFYCPKSRFEELNGDQFDAIVKEFKLCKKSENTGDAVTDKKTPDGMKIASSDKLQYVMYVPASWICDSTSGVSEAYVSESGRPNVTVTAYSYDEEMTPAQYFAKCEDEYEDILPEYTLVDSSERTVGEREAISYVYTAKVGGTSVKIMQTVYEYNALIYSFTYTALEDRFDAHLEDVEAMLDAFRFR